MHVIIINGSPRVQKLSNTAKIIQSFGKGLQAAGASYELYSLSDRREWDAARDAFMGNEQIITLMRRLVPTYHSPQEVNRTAESAPEMRSARREGEKEPATV